MLIVSIELQEPASHSNYKTWGSKSVFTLNFAKAVATFALKMLLSF